MFKNFLILINQKKEYFSLEKKANEFLSSGMYDLYATMINNGYQPNNNQKKQMALIFKEVKDSNEAQKIVSSLFEKKYQLTKEDSCEIMLNNVFENINEEDISDGLKYIRNQILSNVSKKDFSKYAENKLKLVFIDLFAKHKRNIDRYFLFNDELTSINKKGFNEIKVFYDLVRNSETFLFEKENYNKFVVELKNLSNYMYNITDYTRDKFSVKNINYIKEIEKDNLLINELIEKILDDYKKTKTYELNQLMNKTKSIYLKQQVEENTKNLVNTPKEFKINQLPIEIQNVIIKIENNCEKLNGTNDIEIQFVVDNTINKVLPETLKKYLTIDEEYRETLANNKGKNAKDFLVESLTNMNDKLSELITSRNEVKLQEMEINATYTRKLKNG